MMESSKDHGATGHGLPQDHEDQMQLGIRIITTAFQNKMHSLEQEIRGLRLTCEEQRANVAALQKKNSSLEVEVVESHHRSQQLVEENKELFKTVGSLRKQIARLENLKQAVLSSIQDDHAHDHEHENTRVLMSEEFLRGATPLTAAEMGYGGPPPQGRFIGGGGGGGASMSRLDPIREPQASSMYEPTTQHMGSQAMGAGGGAASASGQSPMIDGKKFFSQARSRLSFEAFNLFLASIKRLNNQQQTREETLEEARRIFGPELQDLYRDFEALLNRHGM